MKRCKEAETKWYSAKKAFQQSFALPHDENVLATLGNIHIVRGSIETVKELEAATMRTQVVLDFISKLRGSGYPGYISTVEVTLGSTLVAQFKPQYLGIAHPFTLPRAVDGYDVPGRSGWRRPDEERLKNQGPLIVPDAVFTDQIQVSSDPTRSGCKIKVLSSLSSYQTQCSQIKSKFLLER